MPLATIPSLGLALVAALPLLASANQKDFFGPAHPSRVIASLTKTL